MRTILFCACCWLTLVLGAHAAPLPPNFIVILGEAQGWTSMSVPQDDRNPEGSRSQYIKTPHLDSIALRGMRFSDFYAASPRCTPTRAALFTGRSPAALHMTFVHEGRQGAEANPGDRVIAPATVTELPAHIATIGKLLQRQGYATAHFGKWHCGRVSPREHGFDETDGATNNGGPKDAAEPNPEQCYAIAHLGMDFMTRQVSARKPFYLQLSQYPGRSPNAALPETLADVKARLGTRLDFRRIGEAAGSEEIDKTIGLVLKRLEELGATGTTYIIYTADHGAQGQRANGALSSGKGTVWEGGLRVPFVVAGPGIPPGTFSHVRASTVDLLPTMAALAGIPGGALSQGLEGGSLVATLTLNPAAPPKRLREGLVVHFPHYDNDESGPASAIFFNHYKLIRYYESGNTLLFDLAKDPGERTDLTVTKANEAQTLNQRLTDYLKAVDAKLPVPNPSYDPQGRRSFDRRRRER